MNIRPTKIKVQKESNRYKLFVNELLMGEYIQAKELYYLSPVTWAVKKLKERSTTCAKNIQRLTLKLEQWKTENTLINNSLLDINNNNFTVEQE